MKYNCINCYSTQIPIKGCLKVCCDKPDIHEVE